MVNVHSGGVVTDVVFQATASITVLLAQGYGIKVEDLAHVLLPWPRNFRSPYAEHASFRVRPSACASAPVDINKGQRTQSSLAVSTEPAAMVNYWHHMKPELPAGEAMNVAFQDKMIARLQKLIGMALPDAGA